MPSKLVKTLALAVVLLPLGCASVPPAAVPMRTIRIAAPDAVGHTLVVMLPGVGDRAEQFIESRFIHNGSEREYDVMAVDAHLGYYLDGSIASRLREDVVLPALRDGYREIWLLGVSLGGFGSLLYASEFVDDIDGIVLLAPYLGSRSVVRKIVKAGGLYAWSGTSRRAEPYAIEVWRWLRSSIVDEEIDLILAYGDSDRFAPTYRPLLEVLPQERIYVIDGGHGWDTWTELWAMIEASNVIR